MPLVIELRSYDFCFSPGQFVIAREDVTFDQEDHIGGGHFGDVYKGEPSRKIINMFHNGNLKKIYVGI
jgi:hypothetical protein